MTSSSTVVTELDVIGGEVHGGAWRVTRRIRAVDPDDTCALRLASPSKPSRLSTGTTKCHRQSGSCSRH